MGEDRYDSLYAPWNPSGQKTRLSLLQRMNEEQVDEQTWRDFFRKYSPFIIMMGNCMGLSRDEIKELRSRIFLEISQKGLGAYDREKGTFRSWFKALVKFKALDLLRKRKSAKEIPTEDVFAQKEDEVAPSGHDEELLW